MLRNRVLLVDDEPGPRFGIRRFLKSKGFDVEEADDCASARVKFRAFHPDVTIVDFRLPDGTALDLIPEFHSADGSPVIVLTAYASIDNAVEAVKLGAEQFFTKPVELEALLVVIQRIVGNQRNRRQIQADALTFEGRRRIDPFIGTTATKQGLLEVAHRGTVFLDEIGDMDSQVQASLLKVLEEKRFRRLGDVKDRTVDVRLIAATHRDFRALVEENRFRQDLYYRISTLELFVPPLRERRDDIPLLAESILARLARDLGQKPVALSEDAQRVLCRYDWPGNIRELRNVLERGLLRSHSDVLDASMLALPADVAAPATASPNVVKRSGTLDEVERDYIEQVLREETILFALQRYFQRVGFEVDIARELEEAEALALHTRYDLVIADVALTTTGSTEGLEIIRHLRVTRSAARVIMLTAYGTPHMESEAYRRGADAFLHKPRPLAEIARVAEQLTGGFA